MKTTFLRVLEAENKATALRAAIGGGGTEVGHTRFNIDPESFAQVPRSPFAYWVSDSLREAFATLTPFESEGRVARQGLATADDFRFVRLATEVPPEAVGERWFPFAKGGKYSPFYADIYLCVNWASEGIEIWNFYKPGSDRLASRPQNTSYFCRPGLTWPLRTKSELSFRVMPRGCAFGHKGPVAVVENDDEAQLLALLAIANSKAFCAM
ncbi:MAG: type II restriction endonuclease subunit M, partial [Bradymonadaceae bacterium]